MELSTSQCIVPESSVCWRVSQSGLCAKSLVNGFLPYAAAVTVEDGIAGFEAPREDQIEQDVERQSEDQQRQAEEQRGLRWLDLGGVDAAAPGVARLKMDLGGRIHTLPGAYV